MFTNLLSSKILWVLEFLVRFALGLAVGSLNLTEYAVIAWFLSRYVTRFWKGNCNCFEVLVLFNIFNGDLHFLTS